MIEVICFDGMEENTFGIDITDDFVFTVEH